VFLSRDRRESRGRGGTWSRTDARHDFEIVAAMLQQSDARSAIEGKMGEDAFIPVLKPCPFCGDRAQIVHGGTFRVECPDCGATGPPAPTSERAVVRWNRRGTDAPDDFG
jgi:Lar family restriction alleviation protein